MCKLILSDVTVLYLKTLCTEAYNGSTSSGATGCYQIVRNLRDEDLFG